MVLVRVSRSTAITDLIVTQAVLAIAELLVLHCVSKNWTATFNMT